MSEEFIPYGKQWIDEADIEAVARVLRGQWLTTGPAVERFEEEIARVAGARYAVALNSGTAALHAAYRAVGVGPGTEVVVPPLTFSATANAARLLGATVRFCDVDEKTLTMDPAALKEVVGEKTAVVAAVDYAGHSADLDPILKVARSVGAKVVCDGAHSLGGRYRGKPIGSRADLTTFSFHPVKAATAGEGGAVVTDNERWAARMGRFRNHGMIRNEGGPTGEEGGAWSYDIEEIGYNYRITDLQCALGLSQLRKLDGFVDRRRQIAGRYRRLLKDVQEVELPPDEPWCDHAYHLFVIRVPEARRREIFDVLRAKGIGVQVHYIPVNMLSAYRRLGHRAEDTPVALRNYRRLISIPCYPAMADEEVERVARAVREAVGGRRP